MSPVVVNGVYLGISARHGLLPRTAGTVDNLFYRGGCVGCAPRVREKWRERAERTGVAMVPIGIRVGAFRFTACMPLKQLGITSADT